MVPSVVIDRWSIFLDFCEITALELETECKEVDGDAVLGAVEAFLAGDQKQAFKYFTSPLWLLLSVKDGKN